MDGIKGDVVNEATGEVLSVSNETNPSSDSNADSSDNKDNNKDNNTENNTENNTDNNTDNSNSDNTAENTVENSNENVTDTFTQPGELAETTIVGGEAVFLLNPKDMNVKGFDLSSAQTEDSIADSGNTSSEGEDIRGYSGKEFDVVNGILGHYGGNNSSVNIPENVNKIGNRVFYKNNGINSVSIPSSVNEIGDFSFARSTLSRFDIVANTDLIDVTLLVFQFDTSRFIILRFAKNNLSKLVSFFGLIIVRSTFFASLLFTMSIAVRKLTSPNAIIEFA